MVSPVPAAPSLLRVALGPGIVRSALQIAAVVGTVLNLINQGDKLFAGTGVAWPQVALNYLVPYCVASFSAARNQLRNAQRP